MNPRTVTDDDAKADVLRTAVVAVTNIVANAIRTTDYETARHVHDALTNLANIAAYEAERSHPESLAAYRYGEAVDFALRSDTALRKSFNFR